MPVTEMNITVHTDQALNAPYSPETHEVGAVPLPDGRVALTIRPKGATDFSDWKSMDLDTLVAVETSKNF